MKDNMINHSMRYNKTAALIVLSCTVSLIAGPKETLTLLRKTLAPHITVVDDNYLRIGKDRVRFDANGLHSFRNGNAVRINPSEILIMLFRHPQSTWVIRIGKTIEDKTIKGSIRAILERV